MLGVSSLEGRCQGVPAVTQVDITGGRGWPVSVSGGRDSQHLSNQVKVVGGRGQPIDERNGVVGWERQPVPVEKVSDMMVFFFILVCLFFRLIYRNLRRLRHVLHH